MKGHAGFRSGRRNPFSPPPSAVVVVVEDDTRFWHIRRTQYVQSFAFLAFPLPPLQLGSRHCQSGGFEQRNNERGKKFQILLYYLNGQYRAADRNSERKQQKFSASGFSVRDPSGSTRSGPWTSSEASRGVREAHKPARPGRGQHYGIGSSQIVSSLPPNTWGIERRKKEGR